jgi:tight adherence protein C
MTPAGWIRSLERRVKLAGSSRAWPVERVLAAKLLAGITVLILVVLWISTFSVSAGNITVTIGRFLLAPVLAFGVYMIPDLILTVRGRERQQIIQLELPDALDQMTISVEAGLGFDAALQRFVGSGRGPLVDELRRTLNEIAIGIPRRTAFQHLVERTDVQELRHFVFAVNQAEEYGLPIAHVLRVQAKELRVLRRQRAEERAMKIPVKIVLPLVVCIFPALFVVILVPAMIRIFETLL